VLPLCGGLLIVIVVLMREHLPWLSLRAPEPELEEEFEAELEHRVWKLESGATLGDAYSHRLSAAASSRRLSSRVMSIRGSIGVGAQLDVDSDILIPVRPPPRLSIASSWVSSRRALVAQPADFASVPASSPIEGEGDRAGLNNTRRFAPALAEIREGDASAESGAETERGAIKDTARAEGGPEEGNEEGEGEGEGEGDRKVPDRLSALSGLPDDAQSSVNTFASSVIFNPTHGGSFDSLAQSPASTPFDRGECAGAAVFTPLRLCLSGDLLVCYYYFAGSVIDIEPASVAPTPPPNVSTATASADTPTTAAAPPIPVQGNADDSSLPAPAPSSAASASAAAPPPPPPKRVLVCGCISYNQN
jgi:hypothetical protein